MDTETSVLSKADTVFIEIAKDKLHNYTIPVFRLPEPDSTGGTKELEMGNFKAKVSNVGFYEDVLGDFNKYDFSFFHKDSLILDRKGILGINSPTFSNDSTWFTIQFVTEPGEQESKSEIVLFNTLSGAKEVIDTNVYSFTNASVVKNGSKEFVIYTSGNALCCYDISLKRNSDVAFFRFSGINEDEITTNRIDNAEIKDGKLSGTIIVFVGTDATGLKRKQTGFSVPFLL